VDLALATVARAVRRVRDDVRLPVADKLTVQPELAGALGVGPIGVEHVDESPRINRHDSASWRGYQSFEHRARRFVKPRTAAREPVAEAMARGRSS